MHGVDYNRAMSSKPGQVKKTYFGVTALAVAIISALFLIASYVVSQLNISLRTFSFWSNITLLSYCLSAPLAVILGVIGYRKLNDSKRVAMIAVALIVLPFLVLFVRFVLSFTR